ncbi:low molecular weight phosphatase family protein [Parvibaculum sp.]|uniref:arsenate-mycothiol transferase ArsC n=1 Tax=Parvibaculum sp. TaxID=2024848 RepID=UPI002731B1CB|nr:low molecular weight phosphatase family protein [Parvibaculum sp.]MDP1626557.1 low molecular weight phosphatase family protein [Parvibaculum sp.]MDP2150479.1 low molecular weight phosphatase family protein [Parvibaculum sp.]MDP3327699.1 low molecular weight phosphatase family protein [Parvibaculum sp.]
MAGGNAKAERKQTAPASVLFACNLNSVRSTMAEAILKKLHGNRIFVDSAGVAPAEEADPFTAEVLREDGMAPPASAPKGFDDLEETSFDLIVALTPEARDKAEELTRSSATDVEYWAIDDPLASPTGGNRDRRLAAYRELRNQLHRLIETRFPRKESAAG